MNESGDVLARFHRTLVEEIRAQRPEYLDGPFTVAEIYQNLVPYGTHRDQIGIEMNGDYEDALLRLLSGEGGYLVLESDAALRALREEVEASNPNTGLYREYAAVDVRLDPSKLDGGDSVQDDMLMSLDALAPDPEAEPEAPAQPEPEAQPELSAPAVAADAPAPAPSETAPAAGDAPDSCQWCRAELPKRTNLHFCPFCGTDIRIVPCPACGEELEPDWRFCISCGAEVAG